MKYITILIFALLLVMPAGCIDEQIPDNNFTEPPDLHQAAHNQNSDNLPDEKPEMLFIMKGVGIDIPHQDFEEMKEGGIDILTTEWGMEVKPEKAEAFLNKANSASLKVVMDAGFSYPAWGFTEEDWNNLPPGKSPVWQKSKVQQWVNKFKDHPAVYGWDICNEFGENLPIGAFAENTQWPQTAITLSQLRQARADVLQIDPDKPVMIRMNQQSFDKSFGGIEHNFSPGIAEIVMLNLYSNYINNGVPQWPSVIKDIAQTDVATLKSIDPAAGIWISLGAFEDRGLFKKPTPENLLSDIEDTLQVSDVSGIGFFCWGPTFPEQLTGKVWYLPESDEDLWKVIKFAISDYKKAN